MFTMIESFKTDVKENQIFGGINKISPVLEFSVRVFLFSFLSTRTNFTFP